MIWLAALLVAATVIYLFSCWQVNNTVRDYYRLKAEWDQERTEFMSPVEGFACVRCGWPLDSEACIDAHVATDYDAARNDGSAS